MGPVHQIIRPPLPVAHLFNTLKEFCSPSLDLKGPDTYIFQALQQNSGKKEQN